MLNINQPPCITIASNNTVAKSDYNMRINRTQVLARKNIKRKI